jgi:flavin reductase ActVB
MTTARDSDEIVFEFREAMSQLASGVVMVTNWLDGKPWGMTVSACCSVSMTPPLLLVSLSKDTTSAPAIRQDGRFGVSILGEGLIEAARFGAAKGQAKFVDHLCQTGEEAEDVSRTPVVLGAIAHVDCSVEREIEAGDHVIYLGRVRETLLGDGDLPLVFFSRTYHRLAGLTDLGVGPTEAETVDSLLYPHPMPTQFMAPPRPGATGLL